MDSDEDEEGLCEYERKRLQNIKRNNEFLRSLGFIVKSRRKKKPKRQKVTREDSDDDDDKEWTPGCDSRRTRSHSVKSADNVPDLIDPNEKVSMEEINKRLDKRFQCAMETVEKQRSTKRRRLSSNNNKTTTPVDVKDLPQVFHDEPATENFYGFTGKDRSVPVHKVTLPDEVAKYFESDDEDFKGFTVDKSMIKMKYGKRRKSKRLAKKGTTHYEEPVISDDDDYIFCDDCDTLYRDECPVHGPLLPLDESRGWDQDSKSFTSLPVPLQVTLKMSSIKNAGKGVFTKEFIPKGTRIGPYKGEVVKKEDVTCDTDTSYFWEIKKNSCDPYFIDGKNEEHSNWLRFVNCARNEAEQNLLSFQYHGDIYYRAIKHITPNSELLVWYGEEYAKEMGLSVDYSLNDAPCYICAHCQTEFMDKRNFDIHLKHSPSCHDANPQVFKCGKCGEVFTTLINLQHHIRTHEQNDSSTLSKAKVMKPVKGCNERKQYQCQYCSKAFTQSGNLQTHFRTHTGEKPYQCQYCSKAFTQSGNLQAHLRTHTGEKPYQCQYCSKAFTHSNTLQAHLRTHTGEKPYQCQYCSKAFTKSGNLQAHLRTHTGEKPYQCQYCSKAFTNSGHLQTHLRTHTGEKPYQCQYCSKAFTHSNTLQAHLRTHTGEKPYQCQYCSKAFTQSGHLQTHLRTHTGKKPYQCQYCSKAFSDRSNLQHHLRIHTTDN
ncbi:histone-lysine N-methyltransferase PRDM9-like [Dysidea avara]|uniref:histone-lysine N-methyltransferase PRDM9-like n=1 Tax=Dysidea avara TaxID=196820 RepID=UPI0033223FA7